MSEMLPKSPIIERSGIVPAVLAGAYLRANLRTPMAPPAVDIPLSYIALSGVKRKAWTMDAYSRVSFSPQQLRQIGERTTRFHSAHGIPFVAEGMLHAVQPNALPRLQERSRELLSQGMPETKLDGYAYDESAGVFIVPLRAFQHGWKLIRDRSYLTALNYVGRMALPLYTPRTRNTSGTEGTWVNPDNTDRLRQFFADSRYEPEANQYLAYLAAANLAVSPDSLAELSGRQRGEYNLGQNGRTGFRVTAPLQAIIDQVDTHVRAAWQLWPEETRIPEHVVNGIIDDITRRVDQPRD